MLVESMRPHRAVDLNRQSTFLGFVFKYCMAHWATQSRFKNAFILWVKLRYLRQMLPDCPMCKNVWHNLMSFSRDIPKHTTRIETPFSDIGGSRGDIIGKWSQRMYFGGRICSLISARRVYVSAPCMLNATIQCVCRGTTSVPRVLGLLSSVPKGFVNLALLP